MKHDRLTPLSLLSCYRALLENKIFLWEFHCLIFNLKYKSKTDSAVTLMEELAYKAKEEKLNVLHKLKRVMNL